MNYIFNGQIISSDGKPLVGGKVYVYKHNTSELAITYKDFEGHMNTNPVILDSLGHCNIIVNYGVYDITVRNEKDQLQFTLPNITYTDSGIYPEPIDIVAGNNIRVSKDGNIYTISLSATILNTISNLAFQVARFDTSKQNKLVEGEHITIQDDVISVNEDFYTVTESDNIFSTKTQVHQIVGVIQDRLNTKQNKLVAGDGIYIDSNDVISASKTWYKKDINATSDTLLFDLADVYFYSYLDSGVNFRLKVVKKTDVGTLYCKDINLRTGQVENFTLGVDKVLSLSFTNSYPYNSIKFLVNKPGKTTYQITEIEFMYLGTTLYYSITKEGRI